MKLSESLNLSDQELNEIALNFASEDLTDKKVEKAEIAFLRLKNFIKKRLVLNIDYGPMPGIKNGKFVLFKSGAEKIARACKITTSFTVIDKIVDFKDGIFYYHYRCTLSQNGQPVGQCDGVAHSGETRYTRNVLICPKCGTEGSLMKSKYGDDYYCNPKAGGCGTNGLKPTDKGVKKFDVNQVNTLVKIAQKRAFVGCVLLACGAGEYFTSEAEDNKS